ncbi:DAK2 domain-containing protein [Anaerolineae bacterium CFX8]|nr:DAK2 domain-containing protein [Anaerolineae bacterium CFX8]
MVANASIEACDGHLFKRLTEAGLAWLANNQEKVNQLNAFPVPDGDTGTNMYLTMRKAYEEIAHMDDAHVGNVSGALARGALMGARGNSGVILSQWWRGFAQVLERQAVFDSELFAQACRSAVEMAYKGVVKPVEGTILTVTRQAMEAVNERARSENNLQSLFETQVEAAYESLRRTPDLLPVLKDAGVVDSGGQGWTFMMEGMLRLLRGEDIHIRSVKAVTVQRPGWQEALQPEDAEGYGYDVQFLMKRLDRPFDVEAVRAAISEIGWSTLVVGDENLIKVHVHVHDPGAPISYAIGTGAMLDDVVVENMQLQYQHYIEERRAREHTPVEGVAVVTVASGDGLRRLFAEELRAAFVIAGGQTMNPSTEDFLAAIESLPNDEIILLPNNANVIMAARQAAALAQDKHVRVVPSRTIPQGISAMLTYVNEREMLSHEALAQAMNGAMPGVISCEVTTATRAASLNGVTVRAGQLIGLINDVLAVAGDEMVAVVRELLRKAGADKRELITLYYGRDVAQADAESLVETLRQEYSDQEFELVDGGQPLYPYIFGVE